MKNGRESSVSDKRLLKQLKVQLSVALSLALDDVKEKGLLEIIKSQVTNQLAQTRLKSHSQLFPAEK